MNSGLFSLHNYVINQFIWLLQSTTPTAFQLSTRFPPFHLYAHFSYSPASLFLLILCHLLPSSFSAICLQSVCASREFPFCLWGELRFSLLRSALVLPLYVFHAGKGSSSCMQQGVCSVGGCPIRDRTVWCYNLPIHRDRLSISISLSLSGCSFLSSSTRLSCPYFPPHRQLLYLLLPHLLC